MYRLIFLALLCTACSNATPADKSTENAVSAEKSETTELRKPNSLDQAADVIITNISRVVTLSEEQPAQIKALVAEYDLESLNTDRGLRAKIRQRVIEEVLTPEQAKMWNEALQKSKTSVTVE